MAGPKKCIHGPGKGVDRNWEHTEYSLSFQSSGLGAGSGKNTFHQNLAKCLKNVSRVHQQPQHVSQKNASISARNGSNLSCPAKTSISKLWRKDQSNVTANKHGAKKDETYWKEINAAMALTNLAHVEEKLQGTTSCIIQKSSHISEVKTVKVPLIPQY